MKNCFPVVGKIVPGEQRERRNAMASEMEESNALGVTGNMNQWNISFSSLKGGVGRAGPLRLADSFHDEHVEERGRIEFAVRLLPAIP
jgi:hypothetical protein